MASTYLKEPPHLANISRSSSRSTLTELDPANTIADATDAAIQRISELLKHPDDLNTKLSLLRKKFAAEKSSIDAQLKSLAESQMDNCENGLSSLQFSRDETSTIKKNMMSIDGMCGDAKKAISNYSKIKKVRTGDPGIGICKVR